MFWILVFFFGVGYGIVSIDPTRNRAIISLGIIGKISVCMVWTWYWVKGSATVLALMAGMGDLAFAALFPAFLFQTRKFGFL